jgi:CHD5-like protein
MTTGLQFAIGWWYGRSAVFYLPAGWLGPFTWWLSLPFAPAGESYRSNFMAPSDSRRVRLRELRRLADGLSSCHQSGRARGERIHKSASMLSTRIAIELHGLTDPGQEQGTMAKDDSTDTPKTHPIPQKS